MFERQSFREMLRPARTGGVPTVERTFARARRGRTAVLLAWQVRVLVLLGGVPALATAQQNPLTLEAQAIERIEARLESMAMSAGPALATLVQQAQACVAQAKTLPDAQACMQQFYQAQMSLVDPRR